MAENIVLIIMDGPRYSETFGHPDKTYIPYLSGIMAKEGVTYTNFYNQGETNTVPGHIALTTGNYQKIDNSGQELPNSPSIFQLWLKENPSYEDRAWIIASKDKLEILANCNDRAYKDRFMPNTNCGLHGASTGYRDDLATYHEALKIIDEYHPKLLLVQFKEPDVRAHSGGGFDKYLKNIKISDSLIYNLWQTMQQDPFYESKTAFFITNDHGRHLDDIDVGYRSHGDKCEGCRHISLLAIGPDFHKDLEIDINRSQIDIASTICEMLKLENRMDGEVMVEIFN